MDNSPLPSNPIAEKGVISSILLSPQKSLEICASRNVIPEWFHDPDNGLYYQALCDMHKQGRPVDFISASSFMDERKKEYGFATLAIHAVMTELFTFVPTAGNLPYYLQILQEKYALRCAWMGAQDVLTKIKMPLSLQETHDVCAGAFTKTLEACRVTEEKDWDGEALSAFLQEMEEAANGTLKSNLLPTFIPSLDKEIGGMEPGEVVVVHGLTSTGKSLFSQRLVQQNVMQGKSGAIVTLEMPARTYLKRLTASHGRVSLKSMRNGTYSKGELERFSKTSIQLHQWIYEKRLSIYDSKRLLMTPDGIIAEIRKAKKDRGLSIWCLDYAQLVTFHGGAKNDKRRDQELQHFSSSLKKLSVELDLITVLVAQCGKEGMVFDAPQVESDADAVLSMVPTYETKNGIKKVTGTSGVFVQKLREGRRGYTIPLKMEGEFASIEECEPVKQEAAF